MNYLNDWSRAVHAHSLATGAGVTPQEAVALFGSPSTTNTPSSILYSAMRAGWFRREHWVQPDSTFGTVSCSRYYAIEKVSAAPRPPAQHVSSFDDMKRVRWVFDLGAP